jgi:hypothetical protein
LARLIGHRHSEDKAQSPEERGDTDEHWLILVPVGCEAEDEDENKGASIEGDGVIW